VSSDFATEEKAGLTTPLHHFTALRTSDPSLSELKDLSRRILLVFMRSLAYHLHYFDTRCRLTENAKIKMQSAKLMKSSTRSVDSAILIFNF